MRNELCPPLFTSCTAQFESRKMPKTSSKLSEYDILQTIGTGSFGTCRKVSRKADGKVFVWKEVGYGGMSEREKQLLVQEVNLLRELRHPHIVRYHDRIIDRENCTLYIVMEYCEGGDLRSVIGRCREEERFVEEEMVWKVLQQLLLALEECHKKRDGVHKVLHRDLKPANVFLDGRGNVKLGDFGLARILHHNFSLAQTFIGTPYYMSPEVFSEQAYDEKSDLWSLGCLLHELCTLAPPFTARDQQTLAAKVLRGKAARIPHYYTANLHNTIDSLLARQPSCRPDIGSLLERVETLRGRQRESEASSATTTTCGNKGPHPLLKQHELKAWKGELLMKEKQLVLREGEVERREREVREREAELRKKERGLNTRESAILQKERRYKESKRGIDSEHDRRLLRAVQSHQKENFKI